MDIKLEPVEEEDDAEGHSSNEDSFDSPVQPADSTNDLQFKSSIQASVKRERSPSSISSAADLSLPYHEIDIVVNNVKQELTKGELVAVILLERRTFHERNFACCFCFDIFSSKRLLKHHNLSHHHETKNTHVLNKCENSLSDGNDVQRHGIKLYKCDQCSYSAKRLSNFKIHKLIHSAEKPLKCHQCSFETAHSSSLMYHKMTHSGQKPFKCDQCSFSAIWLCHLKRHKSIHSDKKAFNCDQCSYSAVQMSYLKRHKLIHSDEKPFKCDGCSFKTAHSTCLKDHKKTHIGQKPFQCDQCSYSSVLLSKLKNHKLIHSDEKPFQCDQCSFKTTRASYLKYHTMIHSRKKQL